jgi:hypothetical protein
MAETLKQETEGFPDLEAAYEAVKGVLFGPLDAATVKLKFNEIVKDAKDKRELEQGPLGILATHREDRETRDQRDHQTLTLTVLLASNAAYRALHEEIMAQLPEVENLLDDNQDKLDEIVAREKMTLEADLERVAGRLPDGRFVFKGRDGSIVDENLKPLEGEDAEAAKKIDFTGKMTLEQYRERRKPVDEAVQSADENRRDRVRVGEIRERNTDNENPLSMEQKGENKAELGEIEKRAQERHQEAKNELGGWTARHDAGVQEHAVSTAAMAKPQI